MEVLSCTLNQVVKAFQQQYGKGLFHAQALYKEVFKSGNCRFTSHQAFLESPVLAEQVRQQMRVTPGEVIQTEKDGSLTKFVTRLNDNSRIESVIIPMTHHHTLCVSSQVGCRMGCRFCQTGKMGFKRNLESHEITGQLYNARFVLNQKIRNVVFMGMGEPLDNFNHVIQSIRIMNEQKGFDIARRRITLSTAGLPDGIDKLGSLNIRGLRLAVSVNASNNRLRSEMMPINRRYPLERIKSSLMGYPLPKRGCFLFEYIVMKGVNDRIEDAGVLAQFIKPLPVRLNLIPYNPVQGLDYAPPDDSDLHKFADALTDQGIFVIKRWSKGSSLAAGCGQLGQC